MSSNREKQGDAGVEPEIDSRIQDVIGQSLRAHFDDIVAAPMPDRFLVLLAELDNKEREMSGKPQSEG